MTDDCQILLPILVLVTLMVVISFDGMLQQKATFEESILDGFVNTVRYMRPGRNNINDNKSNNSFCVPWNVNSDSWWTHNPEWEMGNENDTHYCFQRITHGFKREAFRQIYKAQFQGDCSQTVTKPMLNSGWSADFLHVVDGLKHAVLHNRPFQIANMPWHYADPEKFGIPFYKGISPVCPQGNMQCYFLPLSNCPASNQGHAIKGFLEEQFVGSEEYQWYYEYATRRQTWLRKEVYQFIKRQQPILETPCTVIHYCRGDVVLHPGEYKKQYHPIAAYMNASVGIHNNILLITDDQNAIAEAERNFPQYNWIYVKRPIGGTEGGFEIPSKNPTFETTVILSLFQMARQCSQLIHSHSAFATQLYAEMRASKNNPHLQAIRIDQPGGIYSESHIHTVNVSTYYQQKT